MKLFKCGKHKDTLLASNETLTIIIGALLTDPHIEIYKIEKCDLGGWHIFFETRKDYRGDNNERNKDTEKKG
jgi:hypothetical protein